MAVRIGHASIDERGQGRNGAAGDQTGREVYTRDYYSKGWNVVLRPLSADVAEKSAKACEAGCANNHIGYDMNQRNTLHTQAAKVGHNLAKVNTNCETDCSAFMTECAIAAGVMALDYTGNAPTTSTMRRTFTQTGAYKALTDSKYLTSDAYLKRGDILLNEGSHTAMVLTNGSKAGSGAGTATPVKGNPTNGPSKTEKWKGKVTASALHVRSWAGAENKSLRTLPRGTEVSVCDTVKAKNGADWYYIKEDGKYGFCSAKYIARA